MKKGSLIIIIIFCALFVMFYGFNNKTPKYIPYVNKLNRAYITSVKQKYGLSPSMEGGALMDNVKMISFYFHAYNKEYSVEEARKLMVSCIWDYLERINKDNNIKPYLDSYPFTAENLEFQITFYQSPLTRVDKGFVSTVGIVNGKLYYLTFDHEKGKSEDLFRETYLDAEKIVLERR